MIFDLVTTENKKIVSKEDLLKELESRDIDILITLGAGDISTFTDPITELLKERVGQC